MTKVKICGITNIEDAKHAVECGADMLGFNFYRGSKRFVEPKDAAHIVKALGDMRAKTVGVFVNAEIAEIAELVEQVGLDVVQLHGDESHDFVTQLRRNMDKKLVKAVAVTKDVDIGDMLNFNADAILLDSPSEQYGGSGNVFDWETVKDVVNILPRVYLAGGLTPENVLRAIQTVRPYAVDVASGVELSPGKKDPIKVSAFIRAARAAI